MSLFKKLNEQIELNEITSDIQITEAIEKEFIFNGIDYDMILLKEDNEPKYKSYYYRPLYVPQKPTKQEEKKDTKTEEKPKEDPGKKDDSDEEKARKAEEKKELEEEYDEDISEVKEDIADLKHECYSGKFSSICPSGKIEPSCYADNPSDSAAVRLLKRELRHDIREIIDTLDEINSERKYKDITKLTISNFPVLDRNKDA